MADIFVSYTSSDRLKAFWIGQELKKLGHTPRIHEWEIPAGGNIPAWMETRHHAADHVLLVISRAYLAAAYSSWERQAAQWASADKRPNFALPVFIEACEAPTLLAHIKRCDLHGLSEAEARTALAGYLAPAGMPATPVGFSYAANPVLEGTNGSFGKTGIQTGSYYAVSNIPITVPRHFVGRDEDLTAIDSALKPCDGRGAMAALHGLRGVGKTTLAAAYAARHRGDYRATWWIRAETESTMRADLAGFGVRLGWIGADEKEDPAIAATLDQLRNQGEGILLVFDNANNADEIYSYIPHRGAAHIIVTSNAPNWSGVAVPVEIEKWSEQIGADYLIAQAGRPSEAKAALVLSRSLDGLPLAHEQAAAYCARTGLSLADYRIKFEAEPVKFLDAKKDAPPGYHNRTTVAKTFALAIDEAAKLHPAAKPLIVYAALLAAEPIPLFIFSEASKEFGEPFAADLAGEGLDEAVAALRAFALIDRESIADERDASIGTDCIRLHRLVRQVAAGGLEGKSLETAGGALIRAIALVYPWDVDVSPSAWSRARRLDALAMALVAGDAPLRDGTETAVSYLLNQLALYRQDCLAAYAQARPLIERALAIYEKSVGPNHAHTATALNNLGRLLMAQGDHLGARPYYDRALAIREKVFGPDHPETAIILNNLGFLLHSQGELAGARPYYERAFAILESALGADHPDTLKNLNNFGSLLRAQGDLAGARLYLERALGMREKTLGPDHPDTALSLNTLGYLLQEQGDLAGAERYYVRALAIYEKALGASHPKTKTVADNTAAVLEALKCWEEAKALRKKFSIQAAPSQNNADLPP